MNFREEYQDFIHSPFPNDVSDNETLVEILFEISMYDDFICGTIDKYLSGQQIDKNALIYNDEIENHLKEFSLINGLNDEDHEAAVLYLDYIYKIKELLKKIP